MVGLNLWYDVDEKKVTNLELEPLAKYLKIAIAMTDYINGELKEQMAECMTVVDAITPVLVEWIANDGVIPEPAPEGEPPAARQRFKEVGKGQGENERFKQDPPAEEEKKPQDIIKPVTDLVEAA